MKKGGVTVFLSLILTILLSLVLTVIEGAKINAMRIQIECVTDMGLDSAFAEYNRELLTQYDLFFIDTSYGSVTPSFHNVGKHVEGYMAYNLEPEKNVPVLFIRDWLGLSVEEIKILEVSIATDDKGDVFKRQAIDYMKDKVGISHITTIENQIDTIIKSDILNKNIDAEQVKNQQEIDEIELPLEEVEEGKWEEIKLDNPADLVQKQKSKGILSLVIEDTNEISQKVVDLDQVLSNREIVKGEGISPNKKSPNGMSEELIFGEYLMEKHGNYRKPKETGGVHYQMEYLLIGENNDTDNLKGVVNKILMMRQGANAITLYSDSMKVAEADALALTIATSLTVPYLQPLIKHSLLLSWIYAESVGDVKDLLAGGKVPLIKKKDEWQLSFKNMLQSGVESKDRSSGKEGVSYESYLRILLGMMDQEEKVMKSMEIIEMDIRKTEGNTNFRMDGCIDSVVIEASIKSRDNHKFSITRRYEY